MERLINTKLLMMFLARQQLPDRPREDRRANRAAQRQNLKKDGQDLATALVQNGISLDNIRKTVRGPAAMVGISQEECDRGDPAQVPGRSSRPLHGHADSSEPHPDQGRSRCTRGREGKSQAKAPADQEGHQERHGHLRRGRQQVLAGRGQLGRGRRRPRLLHARARDTSRNSPTSPSSSRRA